LLNLGRQTLVNKTPIDEFKRSLASATKAISGEPEMEVSFGGDVAGIVRDQVMLPSLPPKPKPEQIAKARGEADGLALRIALHDKVTHAKNQPSTGPARAVFEAMEQARIESLGGKHLAGLGDNLMASLAARASRKGFDKPDIAKDDNSFAEALGLYAREVLTGRKLPKSCAGIMSAWRPEIEAKAASQMDALKSLLDNQQDFGRSVRDLIQDFDLGEDLADPEENEDSDEETSENEEQQPDDTPDGPQEEQQQGQTEVSDADAQEDDSAEPQETLTPSIRRNMMKSSRPKSFARRKSLTVCGVIWMGTWRAYHRSLRAWPTACNAASSRSNNAVGPLILRKGCSTRRG